jgi:hypothetical protein
MKLIIFFYIKQIIQVKLTVNNNNSKSLIIEDINIYWLIN